MHVHESLWREGRIKYYRADLAFSSLLGGMAFRYNMYLAGFDWGREIAQEGVLEFWIVWVGRAWSKPGFYVTYGTKQAVIFPFEKKNPFPEAVCDIMWHV